MEKLKWLKWALVWLTLASSLSAPVKAQANEVQRDIDLVVSCNRYNQNNIYDYKRCIKDNLYWNPAELNEDNLDYQTRLDINNFYSDFVSKENLVSDFKEKWIKTVWEFRFALYEKNEKDINYAYSKNNIYDINLFLSHYWIQNNSLPLYTRAFQYQVMWEENPDWLLWPKTMDAFLEYLREKHNKVYD